MESEKVMVIRNQVVDKILLLKKIVASTLLRNNGAIWSAVVVVVEAFCPRRRPHSGPIEL